MAARFTVLGPVGVTADGRHVPGAAPRHRAVLGYLLLNAGTVVPVERLADAVWGLTPPETARAQIHAAVTAIRRVLRAAGADDTLRTRASGYLVQPDDLDLHEFGSAVAAARARTATEPREAVADLRAALALWRGVPFADVKADYVVSARALLTDRRLDAFERLADIELALGRHRELVDELAAEAAAAPLRERLCGQLMLALLRSGRQADALAAGRALRTTLAESQGLDPGRAFTALEEALLRDDPSLYGAADPTPLAPRPPARRDDGTAARPAPGTASTHANANYLPYDTPDFAGRADELDLLLRPTGGHDGIVALDGMAGIGKTATAIHVAHRLADRYPDGQLFVDLHAHTAGAAPLDAAAALGTLLGQLGLPAEAVPARTEDRAARWRAELADRRVVVVLDNAADTDHVRALLPGPAARSASLVIVTSRRRLLDLDGARALSLDPLPADDAVPLFTRIVGARAEAEPEAVLDVLRLCGFLPLAVRIAAARLHHRKQWTVAYLAGRLRDQRRRLAELSTAERGVAAAFAMSYEQLDDGHRRAFRLLGLHPGHDIDAHAAAALTGTSADETESVLENLVDSHVLQAAEPGRYTFHDLLRAHARATAAAEEPAEERDAARARLLDHYRNTAACAVDAVFPHVRWHSAEQTRPDPAGASDGTPESAAEAAAWLDAERANLVAVVTHAAENGNAEYTKQLSAILRPYLDLERHAHYSDAFALHGRTLDACRRAGDRAGEAAALTNLGWAYWRHGRLAEAHEYSLLAVEACREAGDRHHEARAHNTLGRLLSLRRDPDAAFPHLRTALALTREAGNRVAEAHVLGSLGMMYAARDADGDRDAALDHYARALALHRELDNRAGQALLLDRFGVLLRRTGDPESAREHHELAYALNREMGNPGGEATSLNGLAEAARCLGDSTRAISAHEAALTLAREVGSPVEQARAHRGLAVAHRAAGNPSAVREHAVRARALYRELGLTGDDTDADLSPDYPSEDRP